MPLDLKAKPGCCEECTLGASFYVPCNQPATHVIGWKGRKEPPIRMCIMCADHNVRNRSGEVVEGQDLWKRAS